MIVWVVRVTSEDHTWSSVDSVWTSELGAEQRADYIRHNDDGHGDYWFATVHQLEADSCTAWPRTARDERPATPAPPAR